jgi:hypothetical protein
MSGKCRARSCDARIIPKPSAAIAKIGSSANTGRLEALATLAIFEMCGYGWAVRKVACGATVWPSAGSADSTPDAKTVRAAFNLFQQQRLGGLASRNFALSDTAANGRLPLER